MDAGPCMDRSSRIVFPGSCPTTHVYKCLKHKKPCCWVTHKRAELECGRCSDYEPIEF